MISRFALNSGFRRFVLAKKYQLTNVAKCFQSTATADVAEWEKHDLNDCENPYLHPAQLVKKTYPNMSELKKEDESVAEMLCVEFGRDMPTINDEKKPERDLVNFPPYVRPIDPPKTRICNLVPEEYFKFFYNKTGVTGPYAFGLGVITFLLSKELLIIEHEMVIGASLFAWAVILLKKFGPTVNKITEEILIQEDKGWLNYQNGSIKVLEEYIKLNKHNQDAVKNQSILFDAKRENVHLQLESEYRRRLMKVYEHTKRKLDYQIATQDTQKLFAQKHMVEWVINSVTKSIGAEQEKLALTNAIAELKNLSSRRAGVI